MKQGRMYQRLSMRKREIKKEEAVILKEGDIMGRLSHY